MSLPPNLGLEPRELSWRLVLARCVRIKCPLPLLEPGIVRPWTPKGHAYTVARGLTAAMREAGMIEAARPLPDVVVPYHAGDGHG